MCLLLFRGSTSHISLKQRDGLLILARFLIHINEQVVYRLLICNLLTVCVEDLNGFLAPSEPSQEHRQIFDRTFDIIILTDGCFKQLSSSLKVFFDQEHSFGTSIGIRPAREHRNTRSLSVLAPLLIDLLRPRILRVERQHPPHLRNCLGVLTFLSIVIGHFEYLINGSIERYTNGKRPFGTLSNLKNDGDLLSSSEEGLL